MARPWTNYYSPKKRGFYIIKQSDHYAAGFRAGAAEYSTITQSVDDALVWINCHPALLSKTTSLPI